VDIYASDEEKGEEIKQWWRDNGTSVVMGIVLGIAVLFGGRYWMNEQQVHAVNASNHYQLLRNLLLESKIEQAETEADVVFNQFATTSYATFSAFELAKHYADNKDLETSKSYLEWVMQNAQLKAQVETARLRLAQILLEEGNYTQAKAQIAQAELASFESLYTELDGDIYLAQGDRQEAEKAYQKVLSALEVENPRYVIIKLKHDDVTGS
jgi:predicted negative regulator of RcsB-dependent stress response